MDNDTVAEKILRITETSLFMPESGWPIELIEYRLYSRWAVEQLIHRLMDCPFEAPDEIVERFIFDMELLSRTVDGKQLSRICHIASRTAEDILYLI